MERLGNKSDLDRVTEIMSSRYPGFTNEEDLRGYLHDGFDDFSFTPTDPGIRKCAIQEILNETLKSPHRVINSSETTYRAVYALSAELEKNPRNVVAGFLLTSVEGEEISQYSVRTKKPITIEVNRTMPYLWPSDIGLSDLQKSRDINSYRKNIARKLRDAVKLYGIGFGILAGGYMGMTSDDILKLFSEENFKKELGEKGWKKIPSESRKGDKSAISEIRVNLDEGTEKGYKDSLQKLGEREWLPADERIIKLHYGIQNTSERTTPCAHFVPASEAAIIAGAEIFKPYDLEKIKRPVQKIYQSFVTSEMHSAHMVFERQYPKW